MANVDPVCGMTVDPATAKAKVEHAGTTYYFCCTGCAQKFQASPEQYLRAKKPQLVTLGPPPSVGKPEAGGAEQGGGGLPRQPTAKVRPLCPEVPAWKRGPA